MRRRRVWVNLKWRLSLAAGAMLLLSLAVLAPVTAQAAASSTTETYIVLYSQGASTASAAAAIQQAGGTLVWNYKEIGVVVARSSNSAFASTISSVSGVEGVSATGKFATRLNDDQVSLNDGAGSSSGDLPNAPTSDTDSLSPLQWDMRQIHAPEAHGITGGSPAVLVGDIDTGIDFNHPDLKQNIDVANSANCLSGAPVPGKAAQDGNGHGTHTAGTIAAASNGFGVVGVAPNVHIAAIKAGTDVGGFFFPEAVVCAFMWAGSQHIDVTNNSYFADPFLFNCRNDPAQHAVWKAEQRAIRFAMDMGVTVVAAEGNESEDLAHPTMDVTSPDFPPATSVSRTVTNACVVIPVEIPGVIGVTADGHNKQDPTGFLKSFYSSFGVSSAQVVAPGGDSVFGRSAESTNGRVLSTWPASIPCLRSVKEPTNDPNEPIAVYCYIQGTSMASPHAAGTAALIISRFGDFSNPQNGHMRPGAVASLLENTADSQPCPASLPTTSPAGFAYSDFTGTQSGAAQTCQGGLGYNSWYGHGQVNALRAVTDQRGNG